MTSPKEKTFYKPVIKSSYSSYPSKFNLCANLSSIAKDTLFAKKVKGSKNNGCLGKKTYDLQAKSQRNLYVATKLQRNLYVNIR